VGPWIEDWTERPGHPYNALLGELGVRAAAYLPVHRDHNLIGLLVVGATDDHATATLSTTFAGLVELADLAGALLASTVSARADSAHEITDSWALWWPVVDRLSLDVRVENEARATLERRFFGGHDVFFADAAEAWAGHVDFVERLASLADAIASTRNVKTSRRPPGWTVAEASVQARVAERVASLADDARVRAYEILGDRPRAVEIMERRLLAD
jgi:hypothetical protein